MRIRTARFKSFFVAASLLLSTTLAFSPVPAHAATDFLDTTSFGTFYRPFAADSPWNKRPINPVLRAGEIKKPLYNPTWIPVVDDGTLSLRVFIAKAGDPSVTIHGKPGTSGVGDPDTGLYRTITIPRWPATVVPASGGDGHADVVDTVTGICLLYTSPSPRDRTRSRMPSSA